MNIEVLVSTMNNTPDLYDKMNIKTDAVIINQCSELSCEEIDKNGKHLRFYSFPERGVGKSRNIALCRAEGDICIVGDDDLVYRDNYVEIIKRAFERYPDADAVMFSLESTTDSFVPRDGRIKRRHSTKYASPHIAFRRIPILKANIFFSLLFGGGSIWGGSGEDTIFIQEMFKKHLKVYGCTEVIADWDTTGESSWFKGYNDEFFYQKGHLYAAFAGKKAYIITFITAFRWCIKLKRRDFFHILSLYYKGIKWFYEQK